MDHIDTINEGLIVTTPRIRRGRIVGFDVVRNVDHTDVDLAMAGLNEREHVVLRQVALEKVMPQYVTQQINHRL